MSHALSIIIAVVLLAGSIAHGASTIERISKSQSRDAVQIFITFDRLPAYQQKKSDRRLDIILLETSPVDELSVFDEDDTIVKILTMVDDEATVISFFFRYPPQKIEDIASDERTLVIDIHPGNRFSQTYEELAERLSGVSIVEQDLRDYTNPLLASPYAANWLNFFSTYETPVELTAPVRFTIPPFPLVDLILPSNRDYRDFLAEDILALAQRQSWAELAPLLEQRIQHAEDLETGKFLALCYGEVLLRLDHFEGAYKQLYLLKHAYQNERTGTLASYLLALLLAINDDPYTADFQLRTLAPKIPAGHPLAPYYLLSRAETSLATNQLEQMRDVLSIDDSAYPLSLQTLRELRQADLLYAGERFVSAFVTYQLLKRDFDLRQQPYSLNGLCDTLYQQKMWAESGACYRDLATQLTDRDQLGMAAYRAALSRLKQGRPNVEIINELSRIEDTFPNTEAGFRAAVKRTDLRYLGDTDWQETAKLYYRTLAEQSPYRPVTEEAYFKEALLYHLHGDNARATTLAMSLLRNIRSGPIVLHAEALLIQILPEELQRLIDEEDYLEALVLSRQNRRFFDNNWLETELLLDLATAYEQLGIYQEALDLFIYLIGIAKAEEKERFYLPLARIAFAKGDYFLVEDFASQYNYNFPAGRYRDDILLYRLKAHYGADRFDRAIDLLPDPLPDREDFVSLAATLYFNRRLHEDVVKLLDPIHHRQGLLPDDQLHILAESLFQLERYDQAEQLLQAAGSIEPYRGQSLYRLAQISRRQGNDQEALNLFRQITETTDNSLWKRLAERELQLYRLDNDR